MKAIIYRSRATGKIVRDDGEYELLRARGRTDEEIAALVEAHNSGEANKELGTSVELVELDELAQFYKNRQRELLDDDR